MVHRYIGSGQKGAAGQVHGLGAAGWVQGEGGGWGPGWTTGVIYRKGVEEFHGNVV